MNTEMQDLKEQIEVLTYELKMSEVNNLRLQGKLDRAKNTNSYKAEEFQTMKTSIERLTSEKSKWLRKEKRDSNKN
jgi:predicted N-acyltransferase